MSQELTPRMWLTAFSGITRREALRFINQRGRFLAALVRPLVWLFIFAAGFRAVLGTIANHLFVQAIEQVLTVVEVPVQIQLGEQQRQVLEVLHLQLKALQLVALGGDGLPVGDDVQVVAPQIGLGHLVGIEQASDQFVEELGLAVLVDALEAVIAQAHLECRQRAALKEAQHPAVEHQFLVEAALLATATGVG